MDFLLECVGFPPDHDLAALAQLAREGGEPVAWRGPLGEHLRLPLAPGLDLRLDREEGKASFSLYPHYQSAQRLRIAVDEVRTLPDSPYDALLLGRANPSASSLPEMDHESYPLACVLTDARRLPQRMERGHVLAVALAGFALDLQQVGEAPRSKADSGSPGFRDGGWIEPLGGAEDPGGCVDLALRVRSLSSFVNPLTGRPVSRLETDAPGRPLTLFLSPWQIEAEGLCAPEPGSWVCGTFLLSGRVAGGLGSPVARLRRAFG